MAKKRSDKPVRAPRVHEPSAGALRDAFVMRRRRWFRVLALLLPLLMVALAELGLRLFGYGYPTSFFLRGQIQGQEVLINNPDFTRRFFPPGLSRSPQPASMPATKAAGTRRIFVFGESAAMGDPEPAFGFARVLTVLLRARYPEERFEVINVAVTAINSHVVREIARECARREGDLWLVYMGNNEVVGPYGAGTVFGEQVPPWAMIRAQSALKRLRLGQLLDALRWRLRARPDTPRTWEGMEMFLKQQIGAEDARMTRVYTHFERNLRDMVKAGEESGATVLLSTVAVNLGDCPPFGSRHRSTLSSNDQAAWEIAWTGATNAEASASFREALGQYQRAAAIDGAHAELQFRLGRCWLALGRPAEARLAFQRACDQDTLRFRADTRLNEIVRTVGREKKGERVVLLDAAAELARASTNGLPGAESFFEHVHLTFAGNYRLARQFAEAIAAQPLPRGPEQNTNEWISIEECAQRLAWTDFARAHVLEEMVRRLELPPFTQQLDHAPRLAALRSEAARARAAFQSNGPARITEVYRRALAAAPADRELHEGFARFLEEAGEMRAAADEWRKVIALAPQLESAYFALGNALDQQGAREEAIDFFRAALRRRPGSPEILCALGLALSGQGRFAEAAANFREATRRNPQFVEARVNLGQMLAQQGRTAEAEAEYREALRVRSNSVPARVNLGKLLASRGDSAAAVEQYRAALGENPHHVVAHYNLANALNALGSDEALDHYASALRGQPDFAEARYNLALLLAQRGRIREALPQFAEVVRLKPDFAEAHFNYGVALAKERRFPEAAEQFGETLRLDPGNPRAKQFLEQIRAMK